MSNSNKQRATILPPQPTSNVLDVNWVHSLRVNYDFDDRDDLEGLYDLLPPDAVWKHPRDYVEEAPKIDRYDNLREKYKGDSRILSHFMWAKKVVDCDVSSLYVGLANNGLQIVNQYVEYFSQRADQQTKNVYRLTEVWMYPEIARQDPELSKILPAAESRTRRNLERMRDMRTKMIWKRVLGIDNAYYTRGTGELTDKRTLDLTFGDPISADHSETRYRLVVGDRQLKIEDAFSKDRKNDQVLQNLTGGFASRLAGGKN